MPANTGGKPSPRPRAARSRRPRWQRALIILGWTFVALVVFLVAFGGGLLQAPFPSDATVRQSGQVTLVDYKGRTITKLQPPERRTPLSSLDDVSPWMIKAITAAEDKNFFSHSGVDPFAIVRALWRDVTGGTTQGGSTITQQYVKEVYTGGARTPLRKIREAALAIRLEQQKPKREILRLYLNTVYFGSGLYGVEAASEGYFNKKAKDLTIGQAALLAGIVPAPSAYSPRVSLKLAGERQKHVLERMVADHDITAAQASSEYDKGIHLPPQTNKKTADAAPEYTDQVVSQLKAKLGPDIYSQGELTVTTPLDINLQQAVVGALTKDIGAKHYGAKTPEAAVIAIDPRTGEVRALATLKKGGYQRGGFDLALQGRRNSGSTIKPFTLATALSQPDHQYTLYTGRVATNPATVTVPHCGKAEFRNAEPGGGYYTLASALAQSVNTVYAPLAADVGLTKIRDLAAQAGIPASDWDGQGACPVFPSQALGVHVSPADLVSAYSTLADHGQRHDRVYLTKAVAKDSGSVVFDSPAAKGDSAMSGDVADQVVSAMRGVVQNGTGTGAQTPGVSHDLFGKTGTTDDFTNAWFVGCDPTLCLGTWLGYDPEYLDNGKTPNSLKLPDIGEVFGGTLPAQIYRDSIAAYAQARQSINLSPLPKGADPTPGPVVGGGPVAPTSSASASRRRPSPTPRKKPSAVVPTTAAVSVAPTAAPPPPTSAAPSTGPPTVLTPPGGSPTP